MNQRPFVFALFLAVLTSLALHGCVREPNRPPTAAAPRATQPEPLDFALAPHAGEAPLDERIRREQAKVRASARPLASLEQLGWLFVAKARQSYDHGFYTLAGRCALAMEQIQPGIPAALLLRGHVLHNQHRFTEAEALARRLVAARGLSYEYCLLGDALVDLGRVDEAADAYQAMLDLKPDPQGHSRAALIRWLKGDLQGAVEAMRVAASAAYPRDTDTAAWMHTQLARYLWQSGQGAEADRALAQALGWQSNYAPALFLRGRRLLAGGNPQTAIEPLRQAAKLEPLPEYQWALADALRTGQREDEARLVEAELIASGPGEDPRSCAIYLATRRLQGERAVRLAREELAERADIFTHDALAWALSAAGRHEEARHELLLALAEGTEDARLFFHAAVILARAGRADDAASWFARATALQSLLLPSEQAELLAVKELIANPTAAQAASPPPSFSIPFPAVVRSGPAGEN